MDTKIIRIIREYSLQSRVRFKKHALVRTVERNIQINEIKSVLQNCKVIALYPEDKPLKSYLLLGFIKDTRPLHILVAIDEKEKYIWIITLYKPDKNKWNQTFTERIK